MNAAKQRREASRKQCWNARRGVAASAGATSAGHLTTISRALSNAPPRIVGIISLSELEGPLEERVRMSLMGGADKVITSSINLPNSVTTSYSLHAKGGNPHITMLANTSSFRPQYSSKYGEEDASVQGALDLCRVCDLVLFLIDGSTVVVSSSVSSIGDDGSVTHSVAHSIAATSVKTSNTTAHLDHLVSERGDRILTAIKAQGLPTPVTVIVHKESNGQGDAGEGVPTAVGAGVDTMDDDDMEEDEYEEAMDDGFNSLHGTLATNRSMKSIRRCYMRRRTELKRYVGRLVNTEFGEGMSKVVEVDIMDGDATGSNANGGMGMDDESVAASVATASSTATSKPPSSQTTIAALIRTLCTISASGPNWVTDAPRPYLVTDGTIRSGSNGVQYDEVSKELELTGYVRGNTSWNCNQLVHVPHLGTFAVKNVKLAGVSTTGDKKEMLPPIVAAGRKVRRTKSDKNTDMADSASGKGDNDGGVLLAKPDPEERESLEMFASPDALEGEQNLIGFDDDNHNIGDDLEDIQEDDSSQTKPDKFQPGTSRPAGWSDYQSAWLDALDPNEEGDDHGELAFALNKKLNSKDTDTLMDDEDDQINAEEKRLLLAARKKDAQTDRQFPDEAVLEDEDTALRDRYARYRAITSFRKSYWDPKENLPDSYGAVYHFASFKATQRDVMEDVKGLEDVVLRRGWGVGVGEGKKDGDNMEDLDSEDEEEEDMARACVPPGAYVTITLEGVPPSSFANLSPHTLLNAVSLLPHENKVSVLHMGLTTQSSTKSEYDTEVPIKSKDVLTFRCGWRTWQSRPIFSQLNLNSDKHKFERYMPSGAGTFFAGSVFGPVTYAQCPVMMFREAKDTGSDDALIGEEESGNGRREFLAHGSMIGADADRIVLKRIVLTGFPTRVHKRHATVKYMFYNPEDVKWFMPAGITTKHGLQGNIVQSVGDHGVMKCLFNAPIKQHDTVCLPLYKRVFPKFSPVEEEDDEVGEGGAGSMSKHFRVL